MTLKNFEDGDFDRGNQTDAFLESSPESLYNPGYSDGGNASERDGIIAIDATPDISQPAKTTLGNYLSNATRGQVYRSRTNSFTVPDGSNNTSGDAYSVSENASTHISPSQAAEQMRSAGTTLGTFLDLAKGLNQDAASKFSSTKNSDYGGGDNPFVETDIKKVGSVERARGSDGHTLLPGIRGRSRDSYGVVDLGDPQNIRPVPESAPLVQKKISEVLRQNRFNSIERAFVENHQRRVPGGYTVQRAMGEYNPNAPEVNEEKLHGVANQLLVRASGHAVPGIDPFDFTSPKLLTNLVPIVPSLTQATSLRLINPVNLEAGNVPITDVDMPRRTDYINQAFNDFDVFRGNSYGTLNSPLEPFSDPYPVGTLTATIGSFVAVLSLSLVIGGITSAAVNTNVSARSRINPEQSSIPPYKLVKGKFNQDEDENFFLNLLEIPRTDYAWATCFITGFLHFLGQDIDEDDYTQTADGAIDLNDGQIILKFLESLKQFVIGPPGYYAVIFRNAARSVEKVIEAVSAIVETFSEADVVGGLARTWSLLTTLRDSASWKFVMTLAKVGNQVLYSKRKTYASINETAGAGISELHSKSRIYDVNTQGERVAFSQSVRSMKHLSMYVLPDSFRKATSVGSLTNTKSAETIKFLSDSLVSRFSSDDVKDIETRLDVEYVPFYFHDLRTNEVISFYAFLSELSDGFSANYTSTQGYGRADEVMVYNNTKRNMSLTFFLGATSDEDHNKMYWDINKLVSMVYPQYSRGRVLQSGNLKFVQPFSQLPTASPMIRLRVGDVVKGNYSRFGLARLFGLGREASEFNGDRARETAQQAASQPPVDPTVGDTAVEVALNKAKSEGFELGQRVIIEHGSYKFVDNLGNQMTNRQNNTRPPNKIGSPFNHQEDFSARIIEKKVADVPAPRRSRGRQGSVAEDQPAPSELSRTSYIVKLDPLEEKITRSRLNQRYLYHVVSHSNVKKFTEAQENSIRQAEINRVQQSTPQAPPAPDNRPRDAASLNDFITNNTLIKSFETTLGKGLAGFITDLKFDWADSPWETKDGSKAPIFMNVSISFSPIHDIPMGLDSDGMMRSVAYNVGNASSVVGSDQYKFNTQQGTTNGASGTGTGGAPSAPGSASSG